MGYQAKVVILTAGFRPTMGGLETHLNDLTSELKKKYKLLVVSLPPLSSNVEAKCVEKEGKNLLIWRVPWVGEGLFYKLLRWPVLELAYLVPPLALGLLVALVRYPSVEVVHAQGLGPAIPGVILGKLWRKRVIVSTHFVFHFQENLLGRVAKWVLNGTDRVLCVSDISMEETTGLGIPKEKVGRCAYWIDLDLFKPMAKEKAKKMVGWPGKFSVLFVGRLLPGKGVREVASDVL